MLGSYVARKLLVFVFTLTGTFEVKKYQICFVINSIKTKALNLTKWKKIW